MHKNQRSTGFKIISQATVKPLKKQAIKEKVIIPDSPKRFAYKGFNKELQTYNKFQYVVGETYTKPQPKDKPNTCTSDGYHFCDNLQDVFKWFPSGADNRYCIVEILGATTEDSDKGITTSMRIHEEITGDRLKELSDRHKDLYLANSLGLKTVRKLQEQFPLIQITGSLALFFHGIRLNRWEEGHTGDLDLVIPFYHQIESDNLEVEDGEQEDRSDTCDFKQVIIIDGLKTDIRIDAHQRYEMIEFDGFRYRVSILEHIMEAKFRYALQGNQKHKSDVYEICGKKVKEKTVTDIDDLLF